MKTMEFYINCFVEALKDGNINRIVYTTDLENFYPVIKIKEGAFSCYPVEDARTAGYVGTGMCAEAKAPVVICVNGDNAYRSLLPAMTEAFYRNLPIIVVTFADKVKLNGFTKIKDVAYLSHTISCRDTEKEVGEKIAAFFSVGKVVHIEFDITEDREYSPIVYENTERKVEVEGNAELFKKLKGILTSDCALYVDSHICFPKDDFPFAVTMGDGAEGYEGRAATLLGASLSGKKKKYVGVITEKCFLHDINTLGNREMNNRVVYIVLIKSNGKLIRDCANDLSFEIKSQESLSDLVKESKKPLLYTVEE